jgi:hypothetical protein
MFNRVQRCRGNKGLPNKKIIIALMSRGNRERKNLILVLDAGIE